jgi:7-cyano-7-deazaguanine tRNA-ribosyltransferase
MMFSLAVALGCDLFDSASYALYAKDGRYMTSRGTHHIEDLQYLPCSCPVCTSYDAGEIIKSENREELLARHNLYVTFAEMREIKQAIREGSLWELVEQRCRAHPKLMDGLRRALGYSDWLLQFDPLTKSTFFYSGPESALRTEVVRYGKKFRNFTLKGNVLIRAQHLENEGDYDHVLGFKPPFGPYPLELSETYPFHAEVVKEPDYEALTVALQNVLELMKLNPDAEFTFASREINHPLMEEVRKKANIVGLYD